MRITCKICQIEKSVEIGYELELLETKKRKARGAEAVESGIVRYFLI